MKNAKFMGVHNGDWKQGKIFKNRVKSYVNEDEALYVIDTGRDAPSKRFIVVKDDAYEQQTGNLELLSDDELSDKYKILFDLEPEVIFESDEVTHPHLQSERWSEILAYVSPTQSELFANALCYNFRTKVFSYYDKKYDSDLMSMEVRITSNATEKLTQKQHRLLVDYMVETNMCPERIFISKGEDGKNNREELFVMSKYTLDGKILSLKPLKLSNK